MRIEVVFGILMTLLNEGQVTAADLAKKFEVSTRSIYRYMYMLDGAGVPLVSQQGAKGGFSILDSFRFNASYFTENEYRGLLECVKLGMIPEKTKVSLTDKLSAMQKNKHDSFLDGIYFDPQVSMKSKLEVIRRSIRTAKRLKITYRSRDAKFSERIVEPHCVLFLCNVWYLYAYCCLRNTFRTFRLSRMNSLEITDDSFIKREFSIDIDYALEPFKTRDRFSELIFLCNKKIVYDVEEWTGRAAITPCGDGFLVSTIQPNDNYLIKELLSYASDIRIISPAHTRTAVINAVTGVIKSYAENNSSVLT